MSDVGMAFPMRSLRGSDDASTDALCMGFYLDEVERQAEIYNACFADVMRTASRGDTLATFRHVQSALFAAIVVHRLVNHPARTARSERLRSLLGLPDDPSTTPIMTMNRVRDHMEHIDERIDAAVEGDVACVSDWYLTDVSLAVSGEGSEQRDAPRRGMRAFCPRLGILFFDDAHQLDMIRLDLDLIGLRHHARKANEQLRSEITGRSAFGGNQLFALECGDRMFSWRTERRKLLNELPEKSD